MKIIIDDEQLNNLLVNKKKHIGISWVSGIADIGSGIALFLAAIEADLGSIFSRQIQELIYFGSLIFAIFLIVLGGYRIIHNIGSRRYDYKKLYEDIVVLNKDRHLYSLIAIKNEFNEYPNKLLLYYDKNWQVYFFPVFRTVDNNEDNIRKKLSENLKIEMDNIEVKFLIEEPNQKKFSVDGKIDKVYDHRFYQANILKFPDNMKKNTFTIDGRKYKWMMFQEMREDRNIMKKNKDVIETFEQYCN